MIGRPQNEASTEYGQGEPGYRLHTDRWAPVGPAPSRFLAAVLGRNRTSVTDPVAFFLSLELGEWGVLRVLLRHGRGVSTVRVLTTQLRSVRRTDLALHGHAPAGRHTRAAAPLHPGAAARGEVRLAVGPRLCVST
jgi:hypothetical protein